MFELWVAETLIRLKFIFPVIGIAALLGVWGYLFADVLSRTIDILLNIFKALLVITILYATFIPSTPVLLTWAENNLKEEYKNTIVHKKVIERIENYYLTPNQRENIKQ